MKLTYEQKLLSIREDVKMIGEYLLEIATTLSKEKISQFPIFIAHKEAHIDLGRAAISAEKSKLNWSYNVSMLEEMKSKQIMPADKAAEFEALYRSKPDEACIFLLTTDHMNFIWCPFSLDDDDDKTED